MHQTFLAADGYRVVGVTAFDELRGGGAGHAAHQFPKIRGVDLTAFLTQSCADRVIELRGESRPHVHLDRLAKADGNAD